ncbi:glycoside hydrolase [Wallemia mellicola]|uniref:Probable beta-glucosidase G n=1 Tax=Wallemia mellicola TaxID=1708541 RepID=A0A4T0MCW5_9BASI|nr:glycoside hydrolase [Wallemia mellicola]
MKFTTLLTLAVGLTVVNSRVVSRQEDEIDASNNRENNDPNVYPPPLANGGKAWADAFKQAEEIVSQMSIEEKAALITSQEGRCVGTSAGAERLGIPQLCMMDGPTGPRPIKGISQFPVGQAAAATWDRDLIYQRSKRMGQEFFDQGIHIALAPVSAGPIGRSPLGGRNWEGSYPDPYANGVYSYLSVLGLQDSHVAATTKHWIGYEQETFRHPYNTSQQDDVFPVLEQEPISSNIDDVTTHEVYMAPFAEAIRAGSAHIMCSYNDVNGTHACNNAYTQNHLLKTELNFQGAVVSDWGGVHHDIESATNGLDFSAPGVGFNGTMGHFWGGLADLVKDGSVPEERVTDAAIRLLTPYYWLGQDSENTPPEIVFNGNKYNLKDENGYRNVRQADTADLIREIGTESVTLLKNTGGLPLNKPERLVALGSDLASNALGPDGCGDDGTECPMGNFNGTLTMGGGSGYTIPPYITTPLEALKQRTQADGTEFSYALKNDDTTIQKIVPRSDATLVFINNWAKEEADRHDINIVEEQASLIDAAVNSSSNVILVLHTPGVVDIEKWVNNENVTAIVESYYPGQETGSSVVPVLFGDVSPSGKLPFTWGKSLDDYPPNTVVSDAVKEPQADFTEGLLIDYKWFDKHNIEPRYEFGFGLSYTTFGFSDITVEDTYKKDDKEIQATNEPFEGFEEGKSLYDVVKTVTATVSNTGDVEGSEVAQLYVSFPGEGQPPRQLRGFEKVKNLKSGESQQVTFDLRLKDLSVWDTNKQMWVLPSGEYTFFVGSSSRDLPLHATSTQ